MWSKVTAQAPSSHHRLQDREKVEGSKGCTSQPSHFFKQPSQNSHPTLLTFHRPEISHMEIIAYFVTKKKKKKSRLSIGGQPALCGRDLPVNPVKSPFAVLSPSLSHCGYFGSWFCRTPSFLASTDLMLWLAFRLLSSPKYRLKCWSAFLPIPVAQCLLPSGCCSILISTLCGGLFYRLLIIFASSLSFSARGFSQGKNHSVADQMLMVSWFHNCFGPWNVKSQGPSPSVIWCSKQHI